MLALKLFATFHHRAVRKQTLEKARRKIVANGEINYMHNKPLQAWMVKSNIHIQEDGYK